jgi:hypothetical protein
LAESSKITLHPTPLCDELAVQFEYAVAQTGSLLEGLSMPWEVSTSQPVPWCEVLAARLAPPDALAAARQERETLAARWAALAGDLRALAPFKERSATYYLLLRARESLPRYQKELADARAAEEQVGERIGAIMKRGGTDAQTGGTIIPARFHRELAQLSERREQAERDVAHLKTAIGTVVAQAKARLGSGGALGFSLAPSFVALPDLPADMLDASAAMSDEGVMSLVTELEKLLGTQIYFGHRPPPRAVAPTPVPVVREAPPEAAQAEAASSADFVTTEEDAVDVDTGTAEADENDIIDWPGA